MDQKKVLKQNKIKPINSLKSDRLNFNTKTDSRSYDSHHKGTIRRPRSSIKKDAINPRDYMKYDLPWSCDRCSHFDTSKEVCTLGYNSEHHRQKAQLESYKLNGKMALCRFLEID